LCVLDVGGVFASVVLMVHAGWTLSALGRRRRSLRRCSRTGAGTKGVPLLLGQEENPLVLWSHLAPGPPSAVLRKTFFLSSESTLSLLLQFLLLQEVVRSGDGQPYQLTGWVDHLDLTVQEAT